MHGHRIILCVNLILDYVILRYHSHFFLIIVDNCLLCLPQNERDSKKFDAWLCHFIPRSNPERSIAGIPVCRGNTSHRECWERRLLGWMTESRRYFSGSGGRCIPKMTFQEGKFFLESLLLSLYSHFENFRNGET